MEVGGARLAPWSRGGVSHCPEHRDPFDRMLAAQAVVEELTLVSKDRWLRELGAEVVWEG